MSSAATTHAAAMPSDEALIAEITPDMRAKLKSDSLHQGVSRSSVLAFVGVFVIPNLAKQFGAWESAITLPSSHLADWVGLLVLLSMIGFIVWGAVRMVRSFVGQPSMLRDELGYRRRHGKWRWER